MSVGSMMAFRPKLKGLLSEFQQSGAARAGAPRGGRGGARPPGGGGHSACPEDFERNCSRPSTAAGDGRRLRVPAGGRRGGRARGGARAAGVPARGGVSAVPLDWSHWDWTGQPAIVFDVDLGISHGVPLGRSV